MEKEVNLKDIPQFFSIIKRDEKYELKVGRSKPITVKFPIKLDKKIARVCAMILDGSLTKDLSNCMFCQKKDPEKVKEFASIIKERFNITPRFSKDKIVVSFGKTLAYFLHCCLDIHKSDEDARIPKGIWDSPKEIIMEYIRYAFAMEGSVMDPEKGDKEIRFHSCDLAYLEELKKLLKEKFDINAKIQKYFIKDYGWKYYLYLGRKEEIIKFSKIGIALNSHQKRLEKVLELCKPRAWEVTLVTLFNQNKSNFIIKEIRSLFPYLGCKRAIHHRLSSLINKGYIIYEKKFYNLTKKGKIKALSLQRSTKIIPLRTKPKENEERILKFISIKKRTWRNQIARELSINVCTVRDVLIRLSKKDKIRQIGKDRFGRKFWVLKEGHSG